MADFRQYRGARVYAVMAACTIGGRMANATKDSVTLVEAEMIAERGDRTPIDGEVVIPADRIEWMQVP